MYTIKEDIFSAIKNEIYTGNEKLFEILKHRMENLNQNNYLSSIEFIKIAFSSHLIEDLEFLISLSGNKIFKIRHAIIIIRDVLEQTIEFIYLLKNSKIISEYLGSSIELDEDDFDLDDKTNLVEAMSQFGQSRYSGGRKTVSKMAEDINEKNPKQDRLSLYQMYKILSEMGHNSYFQAFLEDVGEVESGERETALTEEQITYLMWIIDAFMSAYRK